MNGLFHELRRRNVIKVGIAYGIAAWLVAQILSVVNEPLHLPAWFDTAVIVVLIIGFPFALIVAWAFERTPQGVKRTSSPEAEPAREPIEAADALPAVATDADEASVAVLPFVNMSSDTEQEYFSDGISEELLNQLSKVKGLHVAGRTSSFMFKGQHEDLRVIGQKLSVANILEGSVRKSGNRVRVTAQLIKAADGYHLWSESYDRELDDIFAIQDGIAHAVADALSITLGVGDLGVSTRNVQAYDAYLAGRSRFNLGGRSNLMSSIEHLEQATALDTEFAEAWSTLAICAWYAAGGTFADRGGEFQDKCEIWARRAIEISPDDPGGLYAKALLEMTRRDWIKAETMFERAMGQAPGYYFFHQPYGSFLLNVGRVKGAIEVLRRWARTEPLMIQPAHFLALSLELAGEPDLAAQEFRRAQSLEGDKDAFAGPELALALTRGDRATINEGLDRLLASQAMGYPVHNELAVAMRDLLDDPQAACDALRRFHQDPRSDDVMMTSVMGLWASYFSDHELALEIYRSRVDSEGFFPALTLWRPLHRDMRQLAGFRELLRDLGLVDYWRETGHWGDYIRPIGEDDFEVIG